VLQGEGGDDVLVAIDRASADKLDGGDGYDTAAFDEVLADETRDALLGIENELSVLVNS
jgi:hypothetical protein